MTLPSPHNLNDPLILGRRLIGEIERDPAALGRLIADAEIRAKLAPLASLLGSPITAEDAARLLARTSPPSPESPPASNVQATVAAKRAELAAKKTEVAALNRVNRGLFWQWFGNRLLWLGGGTAVGLFAAWAWRRYGNGGSDK